MGEGRGCGCSEDDGRRLGIESIGRGFLTISGDSTFSVASTNSIFSTIYWFSTNDSSWSKLTISSEMAPSSYSLSDLGSGGFTMGCGINEEVFTATIS